MAILFSDDSYRQDVIFDLLKKYMPAADLRKFPAIGNADDIDYAIIWRPKKGSLKNLPKLKAIFTVSAGVDGIVHDDTLPDVPIARVVDPDLTQGVVEYVVYNVLRFHRHFQQYDWQQRMATWKKLSQEKARERTVGILGMGEMGSHAAKALLALQFNVRGWSRTEKDIPGVRSFFGNDQLDAFLSGTDILVNVLPLTDATRGIINARTLSKLPAGSFLINAGRGGHVVDKDLLEALTSQQIAAAALDVFDQEPLPEDHPYWSHPAVTLTPHIASVTDYKAICQSIEKQIWAFETGKQLKNIINISNQY